jgi:hypothetical protein
MQDKVRIPAIGLIVLGILGVVGGVISLAMGGINAQQLVDAGMPADQAERFVGMMSAGGIVLQVLGLLLSGFIAWAGFQMLHLRSWTAAVVANVLVMIPCVTSCCCVIGLPIGIWGLVVLFNADVKRAFEGAPPPPPMA